MNFVKGLVLVGAFFSLVACGGGGGDPGTTDKTVPVEDPVTAVKAASIVMTLVDKDGVLVTDHALSQAPARWLKIVVKNSAGVAVPYSRVTVTLDSSKAVLPGNGAQLTDTNGLVEMKIAPSDISATGPVLVTAAATVDGKSVSTSYDLQITAGSVALSALTVSPNSLQLGQSANVGVSVVVNGVAATSNSVAVTFQSNCGVLSPEVVPVDTNGRATSVIQASRTGTCPVSASVGTVSLTQSFSVAAAPATNILFTKANPELIYQKDSPGVNSSIVSFKVINAQGNPVAGGVVNASLTNTDGGISFCDPLANTDTAGGDGVVTFAVCSGTLPATVQVKAELVGSNPFVYTVSNILTVQTGLPTQRFFDISATSFNFYAGGQFTKKIDDNKVAIAVHAADRQGNSVPDGTKIIFVSEGGLIDMGGLSSCPIVSGKCTVDLIGQDYRPLGSNAPDGDPRPGRVTVLAYADGEEYFIDKNNNNRYDAGELFEDLGLVYMDKDENGSFSAAYQNLFSNTNDGETTYPLPNGASGSVACPTTSNKGLSVINTCNGKWDRYTKVRQQISIIFSGNEIGQPGDYNDSIPMKYRTQVMGTPTSTRIQVRLADLDGNPLPSSAATSIKMVPVLSDSKCAASLDTKVIGNSTEPTLHVATLTDCAAGDVADFIVTVGDKISRFSVTVP